MSTTPTGPEGTEGTEGPQGHASLAGPAQHRPGGPRRLVRRSDDRMVAGVCAGVADYLGVDVTLVRLVTVLGTVLGVGSLALAYLVAWVLLPEA